MAAKIKSKKTVTPLKDVEEPLKDIQASMPPAVEELQQQPVFEWQVPPPCVVEGHPDDLSPVKIEPETITYFDVYKRRHEGMFK